MECKLSDYMEPFNQEVRGAVAGVLSERLKPWCLGLETLSEKVVCEYLFSEIGNINKTSLGKIRGVIDKNGYETARQMMNLMLLDSISKTINFSLLAPVFTSASEYDLNRFIDQLWLNDCTRISIANGLFQYKKLRPQINERILNGIPDTGVELVEYAIPFTKGIRETIAANAPMNLLPWCLELGEVGEEKVGQYLLYKCKDIKSDEIKKIRKYSQKKGGGLVKKLLSILTDESIDPTADLSELSVIFATVPEVTLEDFLNHIWENNNKQIAITNSFLYKNEHLGALINERVRRSIPNSGREFVSYAKQFHKCVQRGIVDTAPLNLLPWCLELDGYIAEKRVCQYLLLELPAPTDKCITKFQVFARQNNYQAALAFIELLSCESIATDTDLSMLATYFSSTAKDVLERFLEHIWTSTSKQIVIANSLFSKRSLRALIFKRIKRGMPDTGLELKEYASQFNEKIQKAIVDAVPLNQLLWLLELGCVSETKICQYLTVDPRHITGKNLESLDAFTESKQYLQAGFLITLIKNHHNYYRTINTDFLANEFRIFSEKLFDLHSSKLTKIKLSILIPCGFIQHSVINTPNKLTFCEGKNCINNKGSGDDWLDSEYTLCRRKRCDQNFNQLFSESPFYSLAKDLFGISAQQLHRDEKFLRSIAALNRWNEMLEKLRCTSCEKPLLLSEHAKNSVGKMAYSATYWHCVKQGCDQYCCSIKITHCYGCNKVIDSRQDTQPCNPWEIKSYKKFYICKACAACCKKHEGFSGRCPNCGVDKAYKNVQAEQRTKAKCRLCNHQVSIDKQHFGRINDRRFEVEATSGSWISSQPSSLVFPEHLISQGSVGLVVHDFKWEQPILYIYDLFSCLKAGMVNIGQFERYPYIYSGGKDLPTPGVYDLKILERLVSLGKNHRKYTGRNGRSDFLTILDGIRTKTDIHSSADEIINYITTLFNSATPEVWKHYNEVEWPFLRALYTLSEKGLTVDPTKVNQVFSLSEQARNVLVETLRKKGIDTPDHDSLINYVEANYDAGERFAVSRAIQHADYKGFKDRDPLCAIMHKVEKVERGVSVCKALLQQPHGFIPDYQIVGSDTARCTSRNPNLLGLPRELRPIIQAAPGSGIVECDYGQMEVGVMAALAGDQQLIDDYNSGDVYQQFSGQLGLDREQAKLMFLAILYGIGNRTLSHWLGRSMEDTAHLTKHFFLRYPKVADYQQHLVEHGKSKGYVETRSGLKRWVNQQANQAASNCEEIENWQANWFKNFPVQAMAAIIFKRAIIDIASNLAFDGFKLVAPMYDSIAFEAPSDRLDTCTNLVCSAMKRAMKAQFPELSPRVTVNNHDTTCWNAGPDAPSYHQWLSDIIEADHHPDFKS